MRKIAYKFFRYLSCLLLIASTFLGVAVSYFYFNLPTYFNVLEGTELEFTNKMLSSSGVINYEKTSLANKTKGASQVVELKLFNAIPIKETVVKVVDRQYLTPGGTPFGIKLFTKGVIVVDVNNVETASGIQTPAKLAGIQKGDIILTINGREVLTNEEVSSIISSSNGKDLIITVQRDENKFKTVLKPALSSVDSSYKSGLWVRDSSAGIGTVTYYDEKSGFFGGLGHGITDIDTSKIMPLESGEVCPVKINSIMKGQSGFPGELRGSFLSNEADGKLMLNNETGVFGVLFSKPNNFASIPVRLKQDVKVGEASILCTLNNSGIKEYKINIDKIDLNPRTMTKNLTITITDSTLLSQTNGIIQGMSGSPIIQGGELVGAVTHVFVNNPQKGFGIFAENMVYYSNKLAS